VEPATNATFPVFQSGVPGGGEASPGPLKSIRNYLVTLVINKLAKMPVSVQKAVLQFVI